MPGEPSGYRSEAVIPEFEGTIRGGITVVVREADDLVAVQTLCVDRGLAEIAEEFRRALAESADSGPIDLSAYRTAYVTDAQGSQPPPVDDDAPADQLRRALWLAGQVWASQGEHRDELCVAISIADSPANRNGGLHLQGLRPALVFYPGSLRATLIPRARIWELVCKGTVCGWVASWLLKLVSSLAKTVPWISVAAKAMSLVAKGWFAFKTTMYAVSFLLSPEGAQRAIAEDLRKRAAVKAKVSDLARLDESQRDELRGKKGVIILLHGLFSTDVGTFDNLVERWQRRADKALGAFPVIGWPHDTLGPITDNGEDLCEAIENKLGADGPPFVFVCHSRGGLVARDTAMRLFQKHAGYDSKLLGCVTFGTPHGGAKLAKCPLELAAGTIYTMLATWMVAARNGSLVALSHVLRYHQDDGKFEGVRDLRPAEGRNFLFRLENAEHDAAAAGAAHKLDLLVVGGDYKTGASGRWQALWSRLVKWVLGESGHDLVVEIASSKPKDVPAVAGDVTCSHFDYFADDEAGKAGLEGAISYLANKLSVDREIAAVIAAEAKQKGEIAEADRDNLYRMIESIRRKP